MSRILVVDDALIVQELVRTTLEPLVREGAELLFCEDGYEALRLIETRRPDLVLLDVTMYGPNGFEVCRRVKREMGMDSVRIVILSARGLPEDRRRAAEAGASGWFCKPFVPAELLDLVRRLLEESSPGGGAGEPALSPGAGG